MSSHQGANGRRHLDIFGVQLEDTKLEMPTLETLSHLRYWW